MSENQNNYAFIDSQNVNLKFSQEIVFMNNLRGKLEYKRQ